MRTMGVSLGDLCSNDELVELMQSRLQNGEIKPATLNLPNLQPKSVAPAVVAPVTTAAADVRMLADDVLVGEVKKRLAAGQISAQDLDLAEKKAAESRPAPKNTPPQMPKAPKKSSGVWQPASPIVSVSVDSGLAYAKYKDKAIGVILSAPRLGHFVLALNDAAADVEIDAAEREAREMPKIGQYRWSVPADAHFKAYVEKRSAVDALLCELGGTSLASMPYLSATSQANKPRHWRVRFILPLD